MPASPGEELLRVLQPAGIADSAGQAGRGGDSGSAV